MPAIPIHHTDTSDRAWDGPAAKAALNNDGDAAYYKQAFAWRDSDGDPKTKAAYKFIHHFVGADGNIGAASTVGCSAGVAVLNGGRGGTTIPDDDREGVWRHLAAHLKDADMEPPALKGAIGMERKQQDFKFQFKELSAETGVFSGFASVYNVTDLLGDVVEKGAFTKTIREHPTVTILWRHDAPIGTGTLEDTDAGLVVRGKLTLEVQQAREALALAKDGAVTGLSIGFTTVKSDEIDGVRHLREIRLWEVSMVPFPACPPAQITSVKEHQMERKMDFNEALDNIRTFDARYSYMRALDTALSDAIFDENLDSVDATSKAVTSIRQFEAQITELVPKLRTLLNATYGYDFKRLFEIERKEGRRISTASRKKIEEAISQLQALLEEEAAEGSDTGKQATPPEAKGTSDPGAAIQQSTEPANHSKLSSLMDEAKGEFAWNR